MKKQIFPAILNIILIGIVILSFRNLDHYWALFVAIMCLIVDCNAMFFYFGITGEKESFKNPYSLSENDNKRIVRVTVVHNDKLGLVAWGYKDFGVGDLQSFNDYYYISDIPIELRIVGEIFRIESTENGFVFKKIVINGFVGPKPNLQVSKEIHRV